MRGAVEQDRDAVIAVVEDARAAQERQAERLRDKLSGFGKALSPLAPRTNGTAATAAATATSNGGTLREFSLSDGDEGGCDDLVDSAEVRFAVCSASYRIYCILSRPVLEKKTILFRETDGCRHSWNNKKNAAPAGASLVG